mgnify:CR=1 FL=1
MQKSLFQYFKQDVSEVLLPEKFTFPFYYEPHQLSIIAANEVQNYLENQKDWQHNFGLDSTQTGIEIGKMFGVLVVQNQENELGYLAAFSGKLAQSNHLSYFVPTVFDMLDENSFFRKEEQILNEYNNEIDALKNNAEYIIAVKNLETIKNQAKNELETQKNNIKTSKKNRAKKRILATTKILETLDKESQAEGILLKKESVLEL